MSTPAGWSAKSAGCWAAGAKSPPDDTMANTGRVPVLRGAAERVRGGSWGNNDNNVRCAYRNRNNPNNRNDNIGFRLLAHGFHLRILRRPRLAQRESKAGAAASWPRGSPPIRV
ncbi:MAG: hypothetical protein DWI57_07395 [Chloroflexi bacterium]|nr:MAG: hypothetical protein DWI57_07395 [Chloroflexota bacterium]